MDVLQPLTVLGTPEVAQAMAGIGQAEDVVFSADARRVAIAGFRRDTVVVLDIEVAAGSPPTVTVTGCTTIRCLSFNEVHGVALLDDVLMVANRRGAVEAVRLPPPADGVAEVLATPLFTLSARGPAKIARPGSVRATRLATGLFEVVVCHAYSRTVTRHLVDAVEGRSLRDEVVLTEGALAIPDSIALSSDDRWMAISNHDTHTVVVYDLSLPPTTDAEPVATLRGMKHPHGLFFTTDDAALVVVDSWSPLATVFERGPTWSGERTPDLTVQLMSDEMFASRSQNIGDGGNKGAGIHPSGLVIGITSEQRPIEFFDTREVLGRLPAPSASDAAPATRRAILDEVGRSEQVAARLRNRERRIEVLQEQARAQAAKIRVLERWVAGKRRDG
jgi:hypothetical protein